MKNEKQLSCGIIIRDSSNRFLAVHPTGGSWNSWNLPKGLPEDGEDFIDAAIREVKEETGLLFSRSDVFPLYKFTYTKKKDLFLFETEVSNIDLDSLECTSYFQDEFGHQQKEVDKFKMLSLERDKPLIFKPLYNILYALYKS